MRIGQFHYFRCYGYPLPLRTHRGGVRERRHQREVHVAAPQSRRRSGEAKRQHGVQTSDQKRGTRRVGCQHDIAASWARCNRRAAEAAPRLGASVCGGRAVRNVQGPPFRATGGNRPSRFEGCRAGGGVHQPAEAAAHVEREAHRREERGEAAGDGCRAGVDEALRERVLPIPRQVRTVPPQGLAGQGPFGRRLRPPAREGGKGPRRASGSEGLGQVGRLGGRSAAAEDRRLLHDEVERQVVDRRSRRTPLVEPRPRAR